MSRIPTGMKVAYVLVAAFLVLLLVPGVQAEESRPEPRSFYSELSIQAAAGSLDFAATEFVLAGGRGRELNPLGRKLENRIVVKSVATVGIAGIVWKLERTGRPGWARGVRWVWAGLQVLAAGWNTWQGLEARR